jgi:hypothetical protein
MAMSKNMGDREYDKFVEDENGKTAVRVVNSVTDPGGDELEVTPFGEAKTLDDTTSQLLTKILHQLKIMNLHLQSMTDEKFISEDTLL